MVRRPYRDGSRTEDWPAMPAVALGFMLKPDGFFDRSPALDVPPSPHAEAVGLPSRPRFWRHDWFAHAGRA